MGWLGDKFGHKKVIIINGSLAIAAIGLSLAAPTPAWFYLVFALLGANQAGFIVSGITIVFEFCDEDVRPTYIGITNTVMGIFGAIAPMAASLIIEQVNFQALFLVSVIFSVISVLYLIIFVKEPRKARTACITSSCRLPFERSSTSLIRSRVCSIRSESSCL